MVASHVFHIRLIRRVTVENKLFVNHSNAVSGKTDGALDIVLLDIERIAEHDDIAAAHIPVRQQVAGNLARRRINQLIHQQVIADKQRVFHGGSGDYKGLRQHGSSKKQQKDRYGPLRDKAAFDATNNCLHSSHCNGRRANAFIAEDIRVSTGTCATSESW